MGPRDHERVPDGEQEGALPQVDNRDGHQDRAGNSTGDHNGSPGALWRVWNARAIAIHATNTT